MIRERLWLSPWWARGLVQVVTFTVVIGAVVVELYPMFIVRVGWTLSVLAVIALCVSTTGARLYLQRPVRRRGLDAMGGPTQQHRLAVLRALRTGEAPSDHDVLVAAIRYGDVVHAYQQRISRTQRVMQWLVPTAAISYGVVATFLLPLRFGVLLIAAGTWWVALAVVRARRRRRTFRNLDALRAAAGPDVAATTHGESAVALPPVRHRLGVAAVMIPVTVFMTLVYVVIRADPACYYVAAAADLIHDRWQLADPQNMTRGQPDLAAYQGWARQLRDYADPVTDPRLAPRLRRISELADQAVALFAQSRDALVKAPPGYDLGAQQRAFSDTMQELADEDNAAYALCFPRR